jgi:hypothetical protein
VSGSYYVYTLLHFNATKANSTKAYSDFYDTKLIITTGNASGGGGNGSGNSSGKGLISNSSSATPFYVNSTNPRTVNLSAGQCQNVTWWVNATGNISTTHVFFAYANMTSNMSVYAQTASINITIVNQSGGGGGNSSHSSLIHNHTFQNSDHGWTGGINYSAYNGYYEETGNYQPLDSGDLDLTNFSAYRIVMIIWANNSTNAKFSPNAAQYAQTVPYFYYEYNTITSKMNIKFYNGSYYDITDQAPLNSNITWTIDVNRTSKCINATFNWGTAVDMSSKCGANVTNDYVHWDVGAINSFHRVMDFKVYNIS